MVEMAEGMGGAKRKSKDADKQQFRNGRLSQSSQSGENGEKGGKTSKEAKLEEKKQKAKQKKVLRDSNGESVKRPLSAYMLYNNFRRPVLQQEHSGKYSHDHKLFLDLALPDLSKLIGEEWKNMTDD